MAEILNCTPDEYLADPCPTPSLSASCAHTLVSRSPEHAWLEHPRFGGKSRAPSRAMDLGSLTHSLLLGKGKEILIVEALDWRTKAAKDEGIQARADGLQPVLRPDYTEAVLVADAIRARLKDRGVTFDGLSEVPIVFEQQASEGTPVLCRSMLDHLKPSLATIYDLKTIRSAHPKTCERHMVEYGYDVQAAAYRAAVGAVYPDLRGTIDILFVFVETAAPFSVTVARPDGMLRELGEVRWQRAIDRWATCLRENVWPGYSDDIVALTAPAWALAEAQIETI